MTDKDEKSKKTSEGSKDSSSNTSEQRKSDSSQSRNVQVIFADTPVKEERKEWWPNLKRAWFKYYGKHRNQVICAVIGLAVGLGFVFIGFWATLLVAILVTIGVVYGRYRDGDRRTQVTVAKIIDRLD